MRWPNPAWAVLSPTAESPRRDDGPKSAAAAGAPGLGLEPPPRNPKPAGIRSNPPVV